MTVFEKDRDCVYQPYEGLKKVFVRRGKKGDTYRVTAYSQKLKRDVGRGVKIPKGLNKKERERYLIHEQELLEKELLNNTVIPPNICFKEYCEEWYFPRKVGVWKPSTAYNNTRWLKVVNPYFGNIRVRDLKHNQLSQIINRMKDDEISASTMKHALIMVSGALTEAVLDEVIDKNYLSKKMIPKKTKRETKSLSVEEVQALYKEVSKMEDPYWKAAIAIPLFLGLRADEVIGLHWEDVCLVPGKEYIHVNKGVVYIPGKGQTSGTPKSETSNRHQCICEPLVSILKDFQQSSVYTTGPLFRSPMNPDAYVYSGYINKHLKKVAAPIGIDVCTQELRATYCTLSLEPLIKITKMISESLGHSSLDVTKKHYTG